VNCTLVNHVKCFAFATVQYNAAMSSLPLALWGVKRVGRPQFGQKPCESYHAELLKLQHAQSGDKP
jgi:hypothetical protein